MHTPARRTAAASPGLGWRDRFTIHPDGSELKQLTAHLSAGPDGSQGTFDPSWSPDGTQLIFTHIPSFGGLADLYVINRDGSGLRVFAKTSDLSEGHAVWGVSPSHAFLYARHILEIRPAFVKLDLGLVQGVATDLGRRALVAGFVHFAREAGFTLIAEGIEERADLRVLRGLGVDLGQGFLLGRPMRASEIVTLPSKRRQGQPARAEY